MASRMIHLAIAYKVAEQRDVGDFARFQIGTMLPDEYPKNISHLKYSFDDGRKKSYRLSFFRQRYGQKLAVDDLYKGYYLHLVEDMLYRNFVYGRHYWDPRPAGNIEKLHHDYNLLNGYIIQKYGIEKGLVLPADFEKEPLFEICPVSLQALRASFERDFLPDDGTPFFFTVQMAEEFIQLATQQCVQEYDALTEGTFLTDERQYAWDNYQ
ncbi:MAG: hypothetical protein IJZ33_03140 [Clostridia bacterium]|nr:hypothetical protein [Clostridia bacterium]